MFQDIYKIQCSSVFVVFCLWFLSSFALRFVQHSARKEAAINKEGEVINKNAEAIVENQRFRAAIAAERNLLDGLLLLAIGVAWNVFGQGNRTAGDVFSLVAMSVLCLMSIMHYAGLSDKTPFFWAILAFSLLGLYITPLCTTSLGLGNYQSVTPVSVPVGSA